VHGASVEQIGGFTVLHPTWGVNWRVWLQALRQPWFLMGTQLSDGGLHGLADNRLAIGEATWLVIVAPVHVADVFFLSAMRDSLVSLRTMCTQPKRPIRRCPRTPRPVKAETLGGSSRWVQEFCRKPGNHFFAQVNLGIFDSSVHQQQRLKLESYSIIEMYVKISTLMFFRVAKVSQSSATHSAVVLLMGGVGWWWRSVLGTI